MTTHGVDLEVTDRHTASRVALDRGLHQIARLDDALTGPVAAIADVLWAPPQVMIVGAPRPVVTALISSLIGSKAAVADPPERGTPTLYQDGLPDLEHITGPAAAGQPVLLRRRVMAPAIASMSILDVPDWITPTVRDCSAIRADAAVFVLDPGADTAPDALRRWGLTPLTTVGVLPAPAAHHDESAAAAHREPVDPAMHTAHAHVLSAQYADSLGAVVPYLGAADSDLIRRIHVADLAVHAANHRFARVLTALDDLAADHPRSAEIRTVLDWVCADPAMGPVLLHRAVQFLYTDDPGSEIVEESVRLLTGRTDADRCALPPLADTIQIDTFARSRIRVHTFALSIAGSTSLPTDTHRPFETRALSEMIRTYTAMLERS